MLQGVYRFQIDSYNKLIPLANPIPPVEYVPLRFGFIVKCKAILFYNFHCSLASLFPLFMEWASIRWIIMKTLSYKQRCSFSWNKFNFKSVLSPWHMLLVARGIGLCNTERWHRVSMETLQFTALHWKKKKKPQGVCEWMQFKSSISSTGSMLILQGVALLLYLVHWFP